MGWVGELFPCIGGHLEESHLEEVSYAKWGKTLYRGDLETWTMPFCSLGGESLHFSDISLWREGPWGVNKSRAPRWDGMVFLFMHRTRCCEALKGNTRDFIRAVNRPEKRSNLEWVDPVGSGKCQRNQERRKGGYICA